MSNDPLLDDDLAAFTDRLLSEDSDEDMELSASNDLERVVEQLNELIAPDVPPDAAFRSQLTRRLVREWNIVHHRRMGGRYRRLVQVAALAAGLCGVLVILLLLFGQGDQDVDGLQGAAAGGAVWGGLLIMAVVVGVFAWWLARRNK